MKNIFILIIVMFFKVNAASLSPIEYVSPKYFSGLWYEIARTYNSFQHDCVASSVEYVYKDENTYEVYNRCFEKEIGGELIVYEGKAKSLLKDNMAQMDFVYFWIFSKKYKVVYLNDYKSAVVADETLENLWIMSRSPKMNKNEYRTILDFLKSHMDTSKLIVTPQDEKGRYK